MSLSCLTGGRQATCATLTPCRRSESAKDCRPILTTLSFLLQGAFFIHGVSAPFVECLDPVAGQQRTLEVAAGEDDASVDELAAAGGDVLRVLRGAADGSDDDQRAIAGLDGLRAGFGERRDRVGMDARAGDEVEEDDGGCGIGGFLAEALEAQRGIEDGVRRVEGELLGAEINQRVAGLGGDPGAGGVAG